MRHYPLGSVIVELRLLSVSFWCLRWQVAVLHYLLLFSFYLLCKRAFSSRCIGSIVVSFLYKGKRKLDVLVFNLEI
jgi:hypothetical protein